MNENKNNFRGMLLLSAVVLLLALAVTAWAWAEIPTDVQIPVHWNAQGEVDRYGSKAAGLLMGPGMLLFLTVLLAFVPRMEPRLKNLQQSQKAYKAVWAALLIFMAILHLITVRAALGYAVDMTAVMGYLMGVLFMAIGNFLGKIRSNFMFGIRTPWTLSSDLAWNKTHRLGGWLFFIVGALVFVSGFFHSGPLTFGLLLVGLLGSVVFLYGYSYWVWKQDGADGVR